MRLALWTWAKTNRLRCIYMSIALLQNGVFPWATAPGPGAGGSAPPIHAGLPLALPIGKHAHGRHAHANVAACDWDHQVDFASPLPQHTMYRPDMGRKLGSRPTAMAHIMGPCTYLRQTTHFFLKVPFVESLRPCNF